MRRLVLDHALPRIKSHIAGLWPSVFNFRFLSLSLALSGWLAPLAYDCFCAGYSSSSIAITAADGHVLRGDLLVPKRDGLAPAVLLLHGAYANARVMNILARGFANSGFITAVIDARGCGRSGGTWGAWSLEDTQACLKMLKLQRGVDVSRIIVAGHSNGAFHASMMIGANPDVAGWIMIGGWRPTPSERFRRNMLLITGESDSIFTPSSMQSFAEQLRLLPRSEIDQPNASHNNDLNFKAGMALQTIVVPNCNHDKEPFDARVVQNSLDFAQRCCWPDRPPRMNETPAGIGWLAMQCAAGLFFILGLGVCVNRTDSKMSFSRKVLFSLFLGLLLYFLAASTISRRIFYLSFVEYKIPQYAVVLLAAALALPLALWLGRMRLLSGRTALLDVLLIALLGGAHLLLFRQLHGLNFDSWQFLLGVPVGALLGLSLSLAVTGFSLAERYTILGFTAIWLLPALVPGCF